jgi:hypothetical protein
MLKRLRNVYRRALSTELGVVGDEILAVQDTVEALIERFERLQARIGMRELRRERAAPSGGADPLLGQLRAVASVQRDPRGGEQWPEAM